MFYFTIICLGNLLSLLRFLKQIIGVVELHSVKMIQALLINK